MYEGNQSNSLESVPNINYHLMDKQLSSNSMNGNDLNQETTNNICPIEDSIIKLCTDHLNSAVNISSVVNIENLTIKETMEDGNTIPNIPVVGRNEADGESSNSHIRITKLGNDDNISEFSVKVTEADSIDNSHEMCISQNRNAENNDTFMPNNLLKRKNKQRVAIHNALCCKLSTAFAMFSVIGCFLMPIMLYYVNRTYADTEISEDPEYSFNKNASAKVCKIMVACM